VKLFLWASNMHTIVVIGPIDGFYLLGYYANGCNTFYVMHKFCSKELAELTAWRMNSNREKGVS